MKVISFVLATIILISCTKSSENSGPTPTIDVSGQTYTDFFGNELGHIGGTSAGLSFTTDEFALFNSLDTANLIGTTKPDSIRFTLLYPNPISSAGHFKFIYRLNNSFSGKVVAKFVVVDSLLSPLLKMTDTFTGNVSNTTLNFVAPIGRYRLYTTLSSESNKNFFTKWVNLERQN